jgi:hypothetical protein
MSVRYAGKPHYAYVPGAYSSTSEISCTADAYYHRWSFQAVADEYVYVTVDTVDANTAFDPRMIVLDESRAC